MNFSTFFNIGKIAVGVYTGNPSLVLSGSFGTLANSPLAEPVKELLGDIYGDVDWVEIAENYPF